MDQNQNEQPTQSNPYHITETTEKLTSPGCNPETFGASSASANPGYDPQTFGTLPNEQTNAGAYHPTGTYSTTGTYDASGAGSPAADAYQAGAQTAAPQNMLTMEQANAKKATLSLILGIVLCLLNLIMLCSVLLGGGFLYGGLFLIFSIWGIQCGLLGRNSPKKGVATAGLVLNIVALVGVVLFLILGLILNIMEIVD